MRAARCGQAASCILHCKMIYIQLSSNYFPYRYDIKRDGYMT